MRLHSLAAVVLLAAGLVTACSAETESSLGRRGSGATASNTNNGGVGTSPARSPEGSTQQPTSAPATTPAAPSAPLRTNVCENPTCTVGNGTCGCTAQDTSGQTVKMDCQDGVCTCTTGDEVTTQVSDDNCANDGDARTLYSANCGCL